MRPLDLRSQLVGVFPCIERSTTLCLTLVGVGFIDDGKDSVVHAIVIVGAVGQHLSTVRPRMRSQAGAVSFC